jgi:hypothetical protein
MKDIITIILLYLVWNSPIHNSHPTLIPVLLTLYIICLILEIIIALNEK